MLRVARTSAARRLGQSFYRAGACAPGLIVSRRLSHVWEGPPLSPLPKGSFYSFLRQHGDWEQAADLPALTCSTTGTTLTYSALERRVASAARALAQTGFGRGSVLNVHLPNCEQNVIAFLAATELGGIVTPSNPIYTVSELALQQRDSGALAVISTNELRETVLAAAEQSGVTNVSFIEDKECFANAADCAETELSSITHALSIDGKNDLVALPYSSGTTGKPKGVMLTHQNLSANVLQSISNEDLRHDVREGDRLIGVLPLYHIYGMLTLGFSLSRRAHLVLLPKFTPETFLRAMDSHRITGAFLVPPIILFLAKHPLVSSFDLSALRFIVTGAATLDAATQTALSEQLSVPIRQGWGMTELSQVSCSSQ